MQDPRAAGHMLGSLCVDLSVIAFFILILTVLLRGACLLFNKLAGPNRGVPDLRFGKALGITVVALVANAVAGAVLSVLLTAITGANRPSLALVATLMAVPIGIVVTATMTKLLLPTSLGRALLVTLIEYSLVMLIGIVAAAIVIAIAVAMRIGFVAR